MVIQCVNWLPALRPFCSAFKVTKVQLSRRNAKYMASRRRGKKIRAVHSRYPEKKLFFRSKNPAVLHVEGLGWEKMRGILGGDVGAGRWEWVILIFRVNCAR